MKFKCYDKYHKQNLILDLAYMDDQINTTSFSSLGCSGQIWVEFTIDDDTEDPHPERWSDLINWELVK